MKPSTILALSAVTLTAAATYAVASNDDYPSQSGREQWLPRQQIEAQLNQMGYQVDRLKVDDGCIEAYVTDSNGERAELYVDPTTGTPGCRGKYQDRNN
ncbi:MAG: PepSY domain-containing protein [Candidatus Thiodiazotropha sp. (ex. Lucinisca nassula)]|nr:PepSY domain-containing protein [Candidatus Thiodiazotropha sp. (ex. Lucinisca nassula)]